MPIPIRFMTLVIKKQALEDKYPGGLTRFQEDKPGESDEHLVGVDFMSSGEVGELLDLLRALSLDVKTSCAIGDMHLGPLDSCPGIEFYSLLPDATFDRQWYAAAALASGQDDQFGSPPST